VYGTDNSRIAQSDGPLDFSRYRNKRSVPLHPDRIARCNPSHCNLRGSSELQMTTLTPLLNRVGPWRLPLRAGQANQEDQEGPMDQEDRQDRLRRLHPEDLAVPDHPSGRVFYRKPRDLPRRRGLESRSERNSSRSCPIVFDVAPYCLAWRAIERKREVLSFSSNVRSIRASKTIRASTMIAAAREVATAIVTSRRICAGLNSTNSLIRRPAP
jgi:hypothetical protein